MLKHLDYTAFQKQCGQGKCIPVFREFLADMATPVSVLQQFQDDPAVFLLESVEGAEKWARYSFLGLNPYCILREYPEEVQITDTHSGETQHLRGADGLSELKRLLAKRHLASAPDLPPLLGGAIGYVAYDAVRKFEPVVKLPYEQCTPLMCFMLTDEMLIFDNLRHTIIVSVCVCDADYADSKAAYDNAVARIDAIIARLNAAKAAIPSICGERNAASDARFTPEMSCEDFKREVEEAKEAIRNGECIQIVMSQKFTMPAPCEALRLYRALRLINPSPYTFLTRFEDCTLIGASPEELVKLTSRTASVRPIAGTRPRGIDRQSDLRNEDEMLASEKERAEHVMLVDLGRNDIGRVCAPGTVQIKELMTVERYSHVMHLTSHVEGQLAAEHDCFSLFKAAFPAGTLSGAPKIRAMQFIAEHEHSARGIYGGAAGYFSYSGDMDFAIVIRTMILKNGELTMRAGAGIVADSVPEDEYQETLNKSGAVFKAVELAQKLG